MFKAVLLGQWHSLSDPELEHSLITRIDFNLFCRFDELSIPDYSTLCRYRNWLAQDDTLSELLELINRQLTEKGLKIEKASAAVFTRCGLAADLSFFIDFYGLALFAA